MVDGPESRVEVEKVLCRLQEAVKEINTATNDRETRARIQRSWHLQDLLVLPDPVRRQSSTMNPVSSRSPANENDCRLQRLYHCDCWVMLLYAEYSLWLIKPITLKMTCAVNICCVYCSNPTFCLQDQKWEVINMTSS